MRIVSIITSIIIMFTMVLCFASCKAYGSATCDIVETSELDNCTEIIVEKDGHLYGATLKHFNEQRTKCFVIFNNGKESPEDDKIVLLW